MANGLWLDTFRVEPPAHRADEISPRLLFKCGPRVVFVAFGNINFHSEPIDTRLHINDDNGVVDHISAK